MPIAKLLGRDIADPIAARVAADAFRTYSAELRELPHDGPIVRSLAAQHAHHVALAGFWAAQAFDLGLTSAEGILAQGRCLQHGQRAERLSVTLLDVAGRMASTDTHRGTTPALAAAVKRLAAMRAARPVEDEPGEVDLTPESPGGEP